MGGRPSPRYKQSPALHEADAGKPRRMRPIWGELIDSGRMWKRNGSEGERASKASPWLAAAAVGCLLLGTSRPARAFCGFYVAGADAKLFNSATEVVLMRQGARTVLSMRNDYEGPPEDFALVVPVPEVLQEENVKTLKPAVFDRLDKLSAPRLVEYWEQDPCRPFMQRMDVAMAGSPRMRAMSSASVREKSLGVTVEAEFAVGEYNVVILSAKDSFGLETWLLREKYNIPSGAAGVLRPYIAQGMKFFVARVDAQKVKFEGKRAVLSPLRFHFDSKSFFLPVRLGLLNSSGTQDLIAYIIAQGQRYEVANYDNVTIPTNLDVKAPAKEAFGQFYAALYDETVRQHSSAVVTEYAWDTGSCDPCPTPPLTHAEMMTLGLDVLGAPPRGPNVVRPPRGRFPRPMPSGYVVTRLHARYDRDSLGEDLVFRAAPPITGGREVRVGKDLEEGAVAAPVNNFQGRYAVRHPWEGPIACENPRRGVWGGPPDGNDPRPLPAASLAQAKRGGALRDFLGSPALARMATLVSTGDPLGKAAGDPNGSAPGGASGVVERLREPAPSEAVENDEPLHAAAEAPGESAEVYGKSRGCGRCGMAPMGYERTAPAVALGAWLCGWAWRRRRTGRRT